MFAGLFALGAGCGAPAEKSTIPEQNDSAAVPAAKPSSPAKKTADEKKPAPEDPVAKQAAAFCNHAVEDSVMQPLDQLDKKHISACLIAIRPAINQECGKGAAKEIILKIIVDKSGEVTGAFPIGNGADSPEAACITNKVKAVKFPRFIAVPQQVIEKYPFKITP